MPKPSVVERSRLSRGWDKREINSREEQRCRSTTSLPIYLCDAKDGGNDGREKYQLEISRQPTLS
jgi:hypothetical protein